MLHKRIDQSRLKKSQREVSGTYAARYFTERSLRR